MICKQCGAENRRPVFKPVEFSVDDLPLRPPDVVPQTAVYLARWACQACGRYHFRDGSLYTGSEARRLAGREPQP